jgi:hypothetical protein
MQRKGVCKEKVKRHNEKQILCDALYVSCFSNFFFLMTITRHISDDCVFNDANLSEQHCRLYTPTHGKLMKENN